MDPLYDSLALSVWPWLRVGLQWHIEGLEHLPREGPAILAANHISYLDPLVAGYVARQRGRRARFLAKAELFRPPLGLALRALGQIKVDRGSASAGDALADAATALSRGELVVIFPEGTISHETFRPMEFKTGVGRLAQRSGAAVVPMASWGPHRILTKGRPPRPQLGVEVQVRLGPAVTAKEGEEPAATTERVRDAVLDCLAAAQREYGQQPGPGEDPWWVAPAGEDELAAAKRRKRSQAG